MKQLKYSMLLILIVTLFVGCLEFTTNSSPELIEDYSTVTDYVRQMTSSESVQLWAIIERNSKQEVQTAELRIDLISPTLFQV